MSIVKTTTKASSRSNRQRSSVAQRGHFKDRGSVALSAIVALGVVFTVALGMLALGDNVQRGGTRQLRSRGARAMARAGVEYGYWQYAYNGVSLPFTTTRSLGDGRFTTTVTDDSARVSGTIKVESTGSLSGVSQRLIERMLDPTLSMKVFDYALVSHKALLADKKVVLGSGGADGDIRGNGGLSLTNAASQVNGKAVAGGAISITSLTGRSVPNTAHIPFPAIDLAYYKAIANRKYTTGQIWVGFTFLYPGEVIFVEGDITLKADSLTGTGLIQGTGTLVATGLIKFGGNLSYALPGDKLACLAANGFDTDVNCSIVGYYYAHNSSLSAKANLDNRLTITQGSLAADEVVFGTDGSSIVHDNDMVTDLAYLLHLPGY